MKFLVTAIFFFLYWFAPVQVSAKVVFANKVATFIKAKTPVKETIKCAAASNGSEIINITSQTNVRVHSHYAISKYFNNDQLSVEKVIYQKLNLIDCDGFYCKPIGLILIFPEHYFF